MVTAINPAVTSVYEYEVEGDGTNFAESLVSDRNSGTSINTQTTTITLKKQSALKSYQFNLLAYGRPIIVAPDRNGIYHAIGIDDGIDFTTATATGGAKTEMNGYTLTGVSTTGALAPKLNSSAVSAFLALVNPLISGLDTVAVGNSIALIGSGTPAVANTWVSGTPAKATVNASTTNTVYVTGVATGTTVITYTDINGLTATKTITVTA